MTETVEEYKKRVASAGGRAVVAKYGSDYMRKLRKKRTTKNTPKHSKLKRLFGL